MTSRQSVADWLALGNCPTVGKPQPYLSMDRVFAIVAASVEPTKPARHTKLCAVCQLPLRGRQRSRRFCSKLCYGVSRQGRRLGGWATSPPLDWHGRWMKEKVR